MVNERLNSHIIGVDIDRCPYDFVKNGTFVRRNDLDFAKDFERLVKQPIDLLFIDTSHRHEHTRQEIKGWFPLLAPDGMVIFHDTNLRPKYERENGTSGTGWNNDRGVIRAIEDYFETKFDETQRLSGSLSKDDQTWNLEHWPLCNGLTILKKTQLH
jgi:predicted O-methyltransferase YrrM